MVDVGAKIDAHLASLEYQRPHGIEINSVYNQPAEVEKSVSGFIIERGSRCYRHCGVAGIYGL